MPQIATFLPIAAAAASASSTPSTAAVAPAASAAATTAAGPAADDSNTPNFLGQLKTALRKITRVVAQPALPVDEKPVGQPAAPITDEHDNGTDTADREKAPATDAGLPELLAALGFALVPPAVVAPAPGAARTAPSGAASSTRAAAVPVAATPTMPLFQPAVSTPPAHGTLSDPARPRLARVFQTPGLEQVAPLVATPAGALTTTPAAVGQASIDAAELPGTASLPQSDRTASTTTHPVADLAPALTRPIADKVAATPSTVAPPTGPDSPQPSSPAVAAQTGSGSPQAPLPAVAPQTGPGANQAPPPAVAPQTGSGAHQLPSAASGGATPIFAAQQSSNHAGSHQSESGDERKSAASKTAAISAAAPSQDGLANPSASLAASTVALAPVAATPLPVSAQAAAVASQIASHADLYRLPGNRGLRIQLHPDDLGGVEVTVRYSAAGGVELHINVENASTGSLVQAGWSTLRDALGSQGISADRLVMNVTSAGGGSQADLSGGNNGNRSDQNPTSLSQGNQGSQSNQSDQGQSSQQHTASRGWSGPVDNASSTADESQAVAASRIDYRA